MLSVTSCLVITVSSYGYYQASFVKCTQDFDEAIVLNVAMMDNFKIPYLIPELSSCSCCYEFYM